MKETRYAGKIVYLILTVAVMLIMTFNINVLAADTASAEASEEKSLTAVTYRMDFDNVYVKIGTNDDSNTFTQLTDEAAGLKKVNAIVNEGTGSEKTMQLTYSDGVYSIPYSFIIGNGTASSDNDISEYIIEITSADGTSYKTSMNMKWSYRGGPEGICGDSSLFSVSVKNHETESELTVHAEVTDKNYTIGYIMLNHMEIPDDNNEKLADAGVIVTGETELNLRAQYGNRIIFVPVRDGSVPEWTIGMALANSSRNAKFTTCSYVSQEFDVTLKTEAASIPVKVQLPDDGYYDFRYVVLPNAGSHYGMDMTLDNASISELSETQIEIPYGSVLYGRPYAEGKEESGIVMIANTFPKLVSSKQTSDGGAIYRLKAPDGYTVAYTVDNQFVYTEENEYELKVEKGQKIFVASAYNDTLPRHGTYSYALTDDIQYRNGLNIGSDGKWHYYNDNKIDMEFKGLAYVNGRWWYVENGTINFKYTGMAYGNGNWWYMEDGTINFQYTGIGKNDNGFWYFDNGMIDFKHDGMEYYNGRWWYIEDGTINFNYSGTAYYKQWWYFVDGSISFKYTGMAYANNGWWYFADGAIDFKYTGIGENNNGRWYFVNGQIAWNYSGTVKYGDRSYKIQNGKVVG